MPRAPAAQMRAENGLFEAGTIACVPAQIQAKAQEIRGKYHIMVLFALFVTFRLTDDFSIYLIL
jgi:hypothetical protein